MDGFVEREPVRVLQLRADMRKGGPAAAFEALEARLPSLRGRRFYGTFWMRPEGEEYFAGVERAASDPAPEPPMTEGTVPGGLYVRRKILDWGSKIATFPAVAEELIGRYHYDPGRPTIEFYRSSTELHFLVPVSHRGHRDPADRS